MIIVIVIEIMNMKMKEYIKMAAKLSMKETNGNQSRTIVMELSFKLMSQGSCSIANSCPYMKLTQQKAPWESVSLTMIYCRATVTSNTYT